ncbi:uncharacterized protein LOC133234971 isoform X2 [Bos javanicus]|uniref:uncharacterized protein LOC133234971 isoform X2 n=1 Tax=Bos javanicus TaxID=9906 RepID=UPI002AA657B5|nr:uncharacterized protein LOC133234971 isoform X2 [Bos javanicus]
MSPHLATDAEMGGGGKACGTLTLRGPARGPAPSRATLTPRDAAPPPRAARYPFKAARAAVSPPFWQVLPFSARSQPPFIWRPWRPHPGVDASDSQGALRRKDCLPFGSSSAPSYPRCRGRGRLARGCQRRPAAGSAAAQRCKLGTAACARARRGALWVGVPRVAGTGAGKHSGPGLGNLSCRLLPFLRFTSPRHLTSGSARAWGGLRRGALVGLTQDVPGSCPFSFCLYSISGCHIFLYIVVLSGSALNLSLIVKCHHIKKRHHI